MATGYLVRVRYLIVLFRNEKIFGYSDSKFYFILRRVAYTCLAIGARKFSSGLQIVFRLTKKFPRLSVGDFFIFRPSKKFFRLRDQLLDNFFDGQNFFDSRHVFARED